MPPRNRDRLRAWKKKEQMLPILDGAAIKEGSCSSAKYERMYSVAGRNTTKIRNRIKHLIATAENHWRMKDIMRIHVYLVILYLFKQFNVCTNCFWKNLGYTFFLQFDIGDRKRAVILNFLLYQHKYQFLYQYYIQPNC